LTSLAGAKNASSCGIELILPDSLEGRAYETGFEMIEFAWDFAIWAHGEQKYGDKLPYTFHLAGVALKILQAGYSAVEVSIGCLHDTVEDTKVALNGLKQLFPEPIILGVEGMTYDDSDKAEGESIKDKRTRRQNKISKARSTPFSHVGKMHDSLNNLNNIQRFPKNDSRNNYRTEKYAHNIVDLANNLPSPKDINSIIANQYPDLVKLDRLSNKDRVRLEHKFEYQQKLALTAIDDWYTAWCPLLRNLAHIEV